MQNYINEYLTVQYQNENVIVTNVTTVSCPVAFNETNEQTMQTLESLHD